MQSSSPDARRNWSIQSMAHEPRMQETKGLIDEVLKESWFKL
jgi:hypothetical protein